MDYQTAESAHKGIIYVFVAMLVIKTSLMLINKPLFLKIQEKLKLTEMILGPLVLASGILVLSTRGWAVPDWLIVKLVLVAISIPLAIVGFKKTNPVLALLSIAIILYIFISTQRPELRIAENSCPVPNEKFDFSNVSAGEEVISIKDCESIHALIRNSNEPTRCEVTLLSDNAKFKLLSGFLSQK